MRPRLRITPCLFATILGLWLALGSFLPAALAQQRPISAPSEGDRSPADRPLATAVQAVDAIGMTVSDMDRSVEFYSKLEQECGWHPGLLLQGSGQSRNAIGREMEMTGLPFRLMWRSVYP